MANDVDDGWGWLERQRQHDVALLRTRRLVPRGEMVVLRELPPDLLPGLPEQDQAVIRSAIRRPLKLAGYSFERVELEFLDEVGDIHTIWIEPSFVARFGSVLPPEWVWLGGLNDRDEPDAQGAPR